MSPREAAQGTMVIMACRQGDTTVTIDDALEDGPGIVGGIAAEIAEERGLPEDWLTQIGHLVESPPKDNA